MKFKIQKGAIVDVLAKVQGLTGRKSNLAITENVLINAAGSIIDIRATDLESGFEGGYPATVETEGTIAINSRKLFEILKNYPHDEISIAEIENRWIEIGNAKIQYHLVSMNPDDFPETPHLEDLTLFDVDSGMLKQMIEKTIMITGASDDRRAHIKGVLFENISDGDKNLIRLVSTDGSRLSTADCILDGADDATIESGMIIPKKGLHEVSKFLDYEGRVKIGFQQNHFIVKKESETIVILLLEGEFPEYNEIITINESAHEIDMDHDLFTAMLKRMSILSSEDYKGALFEFSANNLKITATNPEIGESKEEMEIEFEGDTIEAAFNPKFFIESLGVIDSDSVILYIENAKRPCIIKGRDDNMFISVIMPMYI